VSGAEVFLEVLDAGGAGDGQCLLAAVHLPSEGDLLRGGVVLLGGRIDHKPTASGLDSGGYGSQLRRTRESPANLPGEIASLIEQAAG
jgi:hypothetical protein